MSDFGSFFDVDDAEAFDAIPDDPFYMEDGVYRWKIVEFSVKPTNAGDKTGMSVKLQCVDGAYRGNTQYGPWRRVPFRTDADFAELLNSEDEDKQVEGRTGMLKLQAQLKKDFAAFGFGADEIRTLNPKEPNNFLGREVMGRIKNKTLEDGTTERRIVAYYLADEVSGPEGDGGFGQFDSTEETAFSMPETSSILTDPKPPRGKAKPKDDVPF